MLQLLEAVKHDISIHAPREGGDAEDSYNTVAAAVFQSTPPARGATRSGTTMPLPLTSFQSTPPARGATRQRRIRSFHQTISIHAPREGGDIKM